MKTQVEALAVPPAILGFTYVLNRHTGTNHATLQLLLTGQ